MTPIKPDQITSLEERCWSFVEERIPGIRKGCGAPAYVHSQRVFLLLKELGFSEEVCVGGLLHDVIEDAGITIEELKALGCTQRMIDLVLLATQDDEYERGDTQWVMLLAQLIKADDIEEWSIKIADILDNIRSCLSMSPERRRFMHQVKGPLFYSLVKKKPVKKELLELLQQAVQEGLDQEQKLSQKK
ncbi:TPA: hypothetical protein DDZ01_03075 [Candidatus Uhrbacteria bacterium]|nr:hypothetical protein [Candidatus Uhrbacteria bacterium]